METIIFKTQCFIDTVAPVRDGSNDHTTSTNAGDVLFATTDKPLFFYGVENKKTSAHSTFFAHCRDRAVIELQDQIHAKFKECGSIEAFKADVLGRCFRVIVAFNKPNTNGDYAKQQINPMSYDFLVWQLTFNDHFFDLLAEMQRDQRLLEKANSMPNNADLYFGLAVKKFIHKSASFTDTNAHNIVHVHKIM